MPEAVKQGLRSANTKFLLFGLFVLFALIGSYFAFDYRAVAANPPEIITYQGKLLVNGSAASTTLAMYFKIYDASAGGNLLYTASGTTATPLHVSTTPSNGLFSINLGDTTVPTNALSPNIFANNSELYLEVTIGATTLTPRKRLTASPYTINSMYLNGAAATSTASSSTYIPISASDGSFSFNTTTFNRVAYISDGTTTSTFSKNNLILGGTTASALGKFYVDSTGNVSASGTLKLFGSGAGGNPVADIRSADTNTNAVLQVGISNANQYLNLESGLDTQAAEIDYRNGKGLIFRDSWNGQVRMAISGGDENIGKIGIGTESPSHMLTIYDGTALDDGLVIGSNTTSSTLERDLFVIGYTSGLNRGVFSVDETGFMSASSSIRTFGNVTSTGNIYGSANNAVDLGSYDYSFKNVYASGTARLANVSSTLLTVSNFVTTTDIYISGSAYVSSLTGGSLVFAGANGLISQDNDKLYWNDSSDWLGIGTTAPSDSLTITSDPGGICDGSPEECAGNGISIGNGSVSSTIKGSLLYVSKTSSNLAGLFSVDTSGNVSTSGTLQVYGVGNYFTDTNAVLGVATSSAGFNFAVGGTSYITGTSTFGNNITLLGTTAPSLSGGGKGIIYFDTVAGKFRVSESTGAYADLVGAGTADGTAAGQTTYWNGSAWTPTSTIYVTSTLAGGNMVGINSSTPNYNLSVNGTSYFTGTTTIDGLLNNKGRIINPTLAGSWIADGAAPNVLGVQVSGQYAYIANHVAAATDLLSVLDVSDPTNPTRVAKIVASNMVGAMGSPVISGNYAYLFDQELGASKLIIYDISNLNNPVVVSTLSGVGPSTIQYKDGNYLYITYNNIAMGNVKIVDVSDPKSPLLVGSYSTSSPNSIIVSKSVAYVACGNNGVDILNVSDPKSPVGIGSYNTSGSATEVAVSGKYAYVADGASGLQILDITSSTVPVLKGTYDTPGTANSIFVSGDYAYVADGESGLEVVDISSSTKPFLVGSYDTPGTAKLVRVYGNYAYVADQTGLQIIDISGAKISNAEIGNAKLANLMVTGQADFEQGLNVRGGVSVGNSGLLIRGDFGMSGVTTNTLRFSTTTILFSGVQNTLNANAFIFNATNFDATLSNYLLRLQSNGVNKFAVKSDGSFMVNPAAGYDSGKFYVDSAGLLSTSSSIFSYGNVTSTGIIYANGGFISSASSTVSSNLQVTGSVTSSFNYGLTIASSGGFVGVGTTTPSEKLTVVGGNILQAHASGGVKTLSKVLDPNENGLSYSVYVSGKYAYLTNGMGISIVDVSDPVKPVWVTSTTNLATSEPHDIVVSGRYAYVTDGNGDKLLIVDVSNPASTTLVGSISTTTLNNPQYLYVSGKYAYVTAFDDHSLAVIDVSNPNKPIAVGTVRNNVTLFNPRGVYVYGKFAYVTANGRFTVIDISDPAFPVIIGSTLGGVLGAAQDVYVSGKYAYVLGSGVLNIFDITNPAAPTIITTLNDGINLLGATRIRVAGKYAYITATTANSFSVIDISSSTVPVLIETITDSTNLNGIYGLFVSGKRAYVTNGASPVGLSILDLIGADLPSANIGSLESSVINISENLNIGNDAYIRNGLNVGFGGIYSQGTIAAFASSTASGASSTVAGHFVGYSSSTPLLVDRDTNDGILISLRRSNNEIGSITVAAGTVSYNAFTGSHYARSSGALSLGMLASLAGNNGGEGGEIIYGVTSTAMANDSKVLGSYLSHLYNGDDGPDLIMSVGNGEMWIVDNGENVQIGDYLISSNIAGHAMKDKSEYDASNIIARVAEGVDWSQVTDLVGGVKHKKVSVFFENFVRDNTFNKNFTVNYTDNTISVGTTTKAMDLVLTGSLRLSNGAGFESSMPAMDNSGAFIFNATNYSSSSADSYILSLRSGGDSVFSIAANGDVHTLGDIYGKNLYLGDVGQPGDLAEKVDIASDDNVEAGDVLVIDPDAPDTYRRSMGSFAEAVAGVVSTDPTIVVGNGKTDYTAVMAMVGRVPVKANTENGEIKRGDLLVTASTTGYVMKYDSSKDERIGMVGVVGMALEPLANGQGKILALIRTGWAYNRNQTLASLQRSVIELASTQALSVATSSLGIEEKDNILSFTDGNLDLQGGMIMNVTSIVGKNDKWAINSDGRFITKLDTSEGKKEMYAMQSPVSEFVFSSSSQLMVGEARVDFDKIIKEIIDFAIPLKISVTLTSGEAKGVYVSAKDLSGFAVKELSNGKSDATFDWVVVAKRKDAVESGVIQEPTVSQALSETVNSTDVTSTSTPTEPTPDTAPDPEPASTPAEPVTPATEQTAPAPTEPAATSEPTSDTAPDPEPASTPAEPVMPTIEQKAPAPDPAPAPTEATAPAN